RREGGADPRALGERAAGGAQPHPAVGLARAPALVRPVRRRGAAGGGAGGASILQERMADAEVVLAVEELRAWLHSFDPDSLVQLDYGGLTRAILFEDLVADHSAAGGGEALGALEAGALDRASELYRTLSERWSALRGRESSN